MTAIADAKFEGQTEGIMGNSLENKEYGINKSFLSKLSANYQYKNNLINITYVAMALSTA